MSLFNICNAFSRMTINNVLIPTRHIFVNAPLYFNVTKILCGEPLKKKKKLDPAIIKAREERRLRRMGKEVRRLQKQASKLKPVFENEPPLKLFREIYLRKRDKPTPTPEQVYEKAVLFKEWNRYKSAQHKEHLKIIKKLMDEQLKALEALRGHSEKLYLEAIKIDDDILPYTANGPLHSPPLENYDPPDGEYIDVSRQFK